MKENIQLKRDKCGQDNYNIWMSSVNRIKKVLVRGANSKQGQMKIKY